MQIKGKYEIDQCYIAISTEKKNQVVRSFLKRVNFKVKRKYVILDLNHAFIVICASISKVGYGEHPSMFFENWIKFIYKIILILELYLKAIKSNNLTSPLSLWNNCHLAVVWEHDDTKKCWTPLKVVFIYFFLIFRYLRGLMLHLYKFNLRFTNE